MNAPATPVAAGDALSPTGIYVKLTLVALFWGGTFIAGRVLAASLPATTAATGRFAIAALLLAGLTWKVEGRLPRLSGRQLLATFALGVTGIFLYNLCFFAALARMPAGRTALFVALNPIATAILLSAVFRERFAPSRWAGIALALFGALVVSRWPLMRRAGSLSTRRTRHAPIASFCSSADTCGTNRIVRPRLLSWTNARSAWLRASQASMSPTIARPMP